MIPTLTMERRQQLIDAVWGAGVIAFTVTMTALTIATLVATVVGFVVIGQWIGAAT